MTSTRHSRGIWAGSAAIGAVALLAAAALALRPGDGAPAAPLAPSGGSAAIAGPAEPKAEADTTRRPDPEREARRAAAFHAALARDTAGADSIAAMEPRPRFATGTSPLFARERGWPVSQPVPRPGAILPFERIVAYYGNPLSRRMGALGEFDPDDMLGRLDAQVREWEEADPGVPVRPALHLVYVVAQADAGPTGHYRAVMRDSLVEHVASMAETRDALVFIDVQTGLSTIQQLWPHVEKWMDRPHFHLGIDPEFMMPGGARPGSRIGTMDAADINWVIDRLSRFVQEHDLPPKVLVIHRFTQRMVTNASQIRQDPHVQVVMHMDGWGAPRLKRDSYHAFVVREPVQFAGFKVFYGNDTRGGSRIMTPAEMLELRPIPWYIQYQ